MCSQNVLEINLKQYINVSDKLEILQEKKLEKSSINGDQMFVLKLNKN